MNKLKIFGFGFGLLSLFLIALFLLVGLFKPKMAGINISTVPSAKVFINNQEVGITPYKDFLKPGKYILRLTPETLDQKIESYDMEVDLKQGIETVLKRDFGLTNETSSGYLLTFEKIGRGKSSISIVSEPDFSEIALDGKSRAIAPYKNSTLLPGSHDVAVRMDGFIENSFKVSTFKGYELLAIVKLAKAGEEADTVDAKVTPTASVTPTTIKLKDKGMGFIEVVNTPTGFLRVRSEPSTLGSEVGQAKPGEKYALIGVDEKTGWYKIEYELEVSDEAAKSGWISNQYAKKVQ